MAQPSAAARKPSAAPTVVLTLVLALASASLLFLLVHLSPSSPSAHPHPHRRLRLRGAHLRHGGATPHQIPFDPVIADLERRLDDREWERLAAAGLHAPGMESAPVPEDLADYEDEYINDAVRFNMTLRVAALFPKIDVDPADDAVTGAELAAWNLASARREVLHRTARELDLHDRDHDGRVAFSEYERPSWAWRFDGLTVFGETLIITQPVMGWDGGRRGTSMLRIWTALWVSRSHMKTTSPYSEFGLLRIIILILAESQTICAVRHYDDETSTDDSNGSDAPARKSFSQLDLDNDGLLSADELKPIIGKLHPAENFYAKQQADYVISQADTNKDGQLSLNEMIENPYVFYSALFTEDDYGSHDELR
ncbi:hypothetical protein TRIUR3_25358 [Triticum urartu]|uniref:EF-hand domain-containing protein n=1 Tax=Triticum urartu TaxID=4572 RepID=M8AJ53_TRIUA|nr:hypothetical protein TRIUR3_25358 [Triticum urartu]